MAMYETRVRDVLERAGIRIGGSNPWDVQVHDPSIYRRLLTHGSLALGESYSEGLWSCAAVDQLIQRLLLSPEVHELQMKDSFLRDLTSRLFNKHRLRRRAKDVRTHYDIGNDLYEPMLGPSMAYTCGYWKNAGSLDEAQLHKFDIVCRRLGLKPGMTLLDLGCGYGSFMKYAAENHGVECVGYTLAEEQALLGRTLTRDLPVTIHCEDYTAARGCYDRVVTIGIIEHLGYKNYRRFFERMAAFLKPDGIGFFHTEVNNVTTRSGDPWLTKYIFPNAQVPSLRQLAQATEGLFVVEDVHNIAPDYDKTLMAWNHNFQLAYPDLKARYDETFKRMWEYYLLSCAGIFRARRLQLMHTVVTRPGREQPDCRVI